MFKPLHRGDRLSASEYNKLTAAVGEMTRFGTVWPLELVNGCLRYTAVPFLAHITGGCGGGGNTWTESQSNGDGTFSDLTDGRSGDCTTSTLYNTTGASLATGSIVWVVPGPGNSFLGIASAGGGGTVTSISAGTGITCTPDPITGIGTVAVGNVPYTSIVGLTPGGVVYGGPGGGLAQSTAFLWNITNNYLTLLNVVSAPTTVTGGGSLYVQSGYPYWLLPSGCKYRMGFAGCRGIMYASQSIPDSTHTAISLDAEEYDTDAIHSDTVNPTRYTIPTGLAGVWGVGATVRFVSGSGNIRMARILANGTDVLTLSTVPPLAGGNSTSLSLSTEEVFEDGDYIECIVYQDSGGALDVDAANIWLSYRGTGCDPYADAWEIVTEATCSDSLSLTTSSFVWAGGRLATVDGTMGTGTRAYTGSPTVVEGFSSCSATSHEWDVVEGILEDVDGGMGTNYSGTRTVVLDITCNSDTGTLTITTRDFTFAGGQLTAISNPSTSTETGCSCCVPSVEMSGGPLLEGSGVGSYEEMSGGADLGGSGLDSYEEMSGGPLLEGSGLDEYTEMGGGPELEGAADVSWTNDGGTSLTVPVSVMCGDNSLSLTTDALVWDESGLLATINGSDGGGTGGYSGTFTPLVATGASCSVYTSDDVWNYTDGVLTDVNLSTGDNPGPGGGYSGTRTIITDITCGDTTGVITVTTRDITYTLGVLTSIGDPVTATTLSDCPCCIGSSYSANWNIVTNTDCQDTGLSVTKSATVWTNGKLITVNGSKNGGTNGYFGNGTFQPMNHFDCIGPVYDTDLNYTEGGWVSGGIAFSGVRTWVMDVTCGATTGDITVTTRDFTFTNGALSSVSATSTSTTNCVCCIGSSYSADWNIVTSLDCSGSLTSSTSATHWVNGKLVTVNGGKNGGVNGYDGFGTFSPFTGFDGTCISTQNLSMDFVEGGLIDIGGDHGTGTYAYSGTLTFIMAISCDTGTGTITVTTRDFTFTNGALTSVSGTTDTPVTGCGCCPGP